MEDGVRRELVLLRHAKSAWPDVPDHQRPLARRGRRDAPVMGRWLRAGGHVPDQVLCSTARRARQTWQLAQAGLGATPPVSFDEDLYQGSAARLLDLIRRAPPAARTLLVVGHDPALPELALTLTATAPPGDAGGESDAAPAAALGRMRAKFPTAAVAVLEFTGNWDQLAPGSARLTSFVTPRDLAPAPAKPDRDPPRSLRAPLAGCPGGEESQPMTTPGSPDRWTFCGLGHIHWGAHGGAGLLLRHVPRNGEPVYLLTERSRQVDEGGTWSMPGGAIHDGESPRAAAHREATEEIWPVPAYRVTGTEEQDCGGGWKFHIVHADVDEPFTAYTHRETAATGWFTVSQMKALRLHPGFRQWVEAQAPSDR